MTADEIRRAASVLFGPGQVVEVRALSESTRPRSGYFDDLDLLAEKADALAADPSITGIYWVLNPVDPDLLARRYNSIGPAKETTTDAGIVRRRWFYIDVDPFRPSGISATDGEKAAAFGRADAIAVELDMAGWPAPVRADSGNGAHLLYRVDLPNDADATALIRRCLEALSARFSDEAVKVDVSVSNAARIGRVYGTPNRKGANMPDRPHRRAALISVPDELEPVPVQLLQALADEADEPATATATGTAPARTTTADAKAGDGLDLRAWLEKHAEKLAALGITVREKSKIAHRYFGEFERCPFSQDHDTGAFIGQADHGGIYARCQHDSCGGAGGPNRWHEIRALVDPKPDPAPKKTRAKADGGDEEDTVPKRTLSFFEEDGRLYVVAMDQNDAFGFVHLDGAGEVIFNDRIMRPDGTIIEPRRLAIHQDSGELMRVVGIPRADLVKTAPLLDAGELFRQMNEHINQYSDMPEIEREIGIYYAMFSWFHTKRSTSPYLRYIGDTGTGKSRCARSIVDLCFLPLLLSGGTSPSALMRQHEKWRGTVFIEEADMKGDASDPVVKWLNAGFERGSWIMLSDKNDPNKQQAFAPYGPKVLAMRTPFKDNATESRCLSYSPRETHRKDIPAELSKAYDEAIPVLRARICRFVLEHWNEFDPEWVIDVDGIAPRVRQMSEPISCVLQYFPDGEERYRVYVKARQQDLKRTRAESKEGSFFNEALARAQGDDDDGPADVVTAKMIAEAFKTTPTAVTTALKSIGFVIERDRVEVTEKVKDEVVTRKKKVRKLVVPSPAIWTEITSRYYFDQEDEQAPECPDALRGSGWPIDRDEPTEPADPFLNWGGGRVQQVVQSVQVVQPDGEIPDRGPPGPLGPLTEDSPTLSPGAYVHIQADPNPCRQCGAARSHYVASSSGSPMIDMSDPTNHYLCKACHDRQSMSPETDADEVPA